MKFKNPLLAVTDLQKTIAFYRQTLGLQVTEDFGANVTMTGGVSFQTKESWKEFIHVSEEELHFRGKVSELYFEEDDFDGFLERLSAMDGISYVHPVVEHRWGQRAVRIYDPDGHIIEIGENMKTVCRRFLDSGLSEEETAKRMDVSVEYVKRMAMK